MFSSSVGFSLPRFSLPDLPAPMWPPPLLKPVGLSCSLRVLFFLVVSVGSAMVFINALCRDCSTHGCSHLTNKKSGRRPDLFSYGQNGNQKGAGDTGVERPFMLDMIGPTPGNQDIDIQQVFHGNSARSSRTDSVVRGGWFSGAAKIIAPVCGQRT